MDYHIVSQGKTTIPSVDDNEEMGLTDVRLCTSENRYKIVPYQLYCPYIH